MFRNSSLTLWLGLAAVGSVTVAPLPVVQASDQEKTLEEEIGRGAVRAKFREDFKEKELGHTLTWQHLTTYDFDSNKDRLATWINGESKGIAPRKNAVLPCRHLVDFVLRDDETTANFIPTITSDVLTYLGSPEKLPNDSSKASYAVHLVSYTQRKVVKKFDGKNVSPQAEFALSTAKKRLEDYLTTYLSSALTGGTEDSAYVALTGVEHARFGRTKFNDTSFYKRTEDARNDLARRAQVQLQTAQAASYQRETDEIASETTKLTAQAEKDGVEQWELAARIHTATSDITWKWRSYRERTKRGLKFLKRNYSAALTDSSQPK